MGARTVEIHMLAVLYLFVCPPTTAVGQCRYIQTQRRDISCSVRDESPGYKSSILNDQRRTINSRILCSEKVYTIRKTNTPGW